MLSQALLSALFAASAFAQELGETGPNNQTTPTLHDGEIIVHVVQVGKETNQFTPNSILANPGDKVMFQFYKGNHSVIQSLYGWPCMPRNTVDGSDGFFSGFFPQVDSDNPPTWNLTIADTNPIWYYCGLVGSCVDWGMLGVINPTKDTNLTAQIELARQSKIMIEPGQTLPANEAASVSSLANQITPSQDNEKSSGGLSGGAIAGIVVGSVVGAALVGALLFFLIRRNKILKKRLSQKEEIAEKAPTQNGGVGMVHVDLPQYQQYTTPQELKEKSPERQSGIQQPQVALVPVALAPGQQIDSGQVAPMQAQNVYVGVVNPTATKSIANGYIRELDATAPRHELAEHPGSPQDGERGRQGA